MHDGMELVFVHRGDVPLAFENRYLQLSEGQTALYWAAIPRVILRPCDSVCSFVEIPLDRFLAWHLPEALATRLLGGDPLGGLEGDVESMAVLKWEDDLASDDPYVRRAAELEIQACVLRLARKSAVMTAVGFEPTVWRQAVAFILGHLEEELTVQRIADAIGRHPSHAMRLFRKQTGFTLNAFILRHRLARAKRLLIGTRLSVGEVALRSGFGSERRFFEVFRQAEGCPPGVYRRRHSLSGGET